MFIQQYKSIVKKTAELSLNMKNTFLLFPDLNYYFTLVYENVLIKLDDLMHNVCITTWVQEMKDIFTEPWGIKRQERGDFYRILSKKWKV